MQLDPACDRLVQRVAGDRAAALVDAGATVLDVRTLGEFVALGHIPGARLLPVNLIACAPAMLDAPDTPVLVCCEHAVRSRVAARLLAQAGFSQVFELTDGMAAWTGPRVFSETAVSGPSSWLLENADLLPSTGRVLDLACGGGRHALLLAAAGFDVTAVDRDAEALGKLRGYADRLGLALHVHEVDLEVQPVEAAFGDWDGGVYELILVTRYLHRPLLPHLVRRLSRKGTLLYETFLEAQAERGRPTNPDFLLKPGELPQLVEPLEIVRSREGAFDGAMVSGVAARWPPEAR
jgi:rhodanese-related sulfurtransferase